MHIGISLVFLVPGKTGGMEIHARELIAALQRTAPGMKITTFINRETAESKDRSWLERTQQIVLPVYASNRLQWVLAEQMLLPRAAAKAGVQLLHSLSSTSPVKTACRRVVTIQDLHYRIYPETHSGLRAYGMRLLVPAAARTAHRLIAISQNTADDVVRYLHIQKEKIDVIPLGVGNSARVAPLAEGILRDRYSLGQRPVLLTMAAKRPHKNLRRLLDALALIPKEERPILILPGYSTDYEEELKRHARQIGVSDDVRFLGWIPDDEVEGFYQAAAAFIFPSLYEGFGLPVLEAMVRGVPVASSDRGSLKEVAGDAALLFNPEETTEMTAAIRSLLSDEKESERLQGAGRKRAALFSWDRTAEQTRATYAKVIAA